MTTQARKYAIRYDDPCNPGFAVDTWTTTALSFEHALERFYEADDGFRALQIARKTDKPKHRWRWHDC